MKTAILPLEHSKLLSGRLCLATYHCSALRASSTSVHAALRPLSCPPRASDIGKAYLIFLFEVQGIDSPHRQLLPIRLMVQIVVFGQGIYLSWLSFCYLPRLLAQVNLLALVRPLSKAGEST